MTNGKIYGLGFDWNCANTRGIDSVADHND